MKHHWVQDCKGMCVAQQTAQANVLQDHAFEIVMALFDNHLREAGVSLTRLNL